MKNLWSIILLASLFSCTTPQAPKEEPKVKEKISYANLPKEYKKCKDGKIVAEGYIEFAPGKMCAFQEYDIDNNGTSDVIVIYSKGKPIAFGFDLDKDKMFRRDEILIDDYEDELNGNERPISEPKDSKNAA